MLRRVIAVLAVAVGILATAAVPAQAAVTTACRIGAYSPNCLVWWGKVSWVPDGDTMLVDVTGDGTSKPRAIRLAGVQAMEQTVYHPTVAKRRGECHALAATARVEALVRAGGGVVRLTAMHAGSSSRGRELRSIAVKVNGQYVDIGLDLIRNGYALWLPFPEEWAWNPVYRTAAQLAAREGKHMYRTDTCGVGPSQTSKLSMFVMYDPPGDEHDNVNGEYMRVTNGSAATVPLAGWWVRDSMLRRYTFPAGTNLTAGASIYVHVGTGRNTVNHKYWGIDIPIFANPTFDNQAVGDGGYLFDPRGDLRAWMLYPCVAACA